MLIDGEKYACEACVRGHRVSNCQHSGKSQCLQQLSPIWWCLAAPLRAPLSLRMPALRVYVSLAVPQTSDTIDSSLSGPLEPAQKGKDERKEQTKSEDERRRNLLF